MVPKGTANCPAKYPPSDATEQFPARRAPPRQPPERAPPRFAADPATRPAWPAASHLPSPYPSAAGPANKLRPSTGAPPPPRPPPAATTLPPQSGPPCPAGAPQPGTQRGKHYPRHQPGQGKHVRQQKGVGIHHRQAQQQEAEQCPAPRLPARRKVQAAHRQRGRKWLIPQPGSARGCGSPQARHVAPSRSQLSTGILSRLAIGWSHWRQWDRGHTTDSPTGKRTMQTLRKLPSSKPHNPKKIQGIMRSGRMCRRHGNRGNNPQAHRLHCWNEP